MLFKSSSILVLLYVDHLKVVPLFFDVIATVALCLAVVCFLSLTLSVLGKALVLHCDLSRVASFLFFL